MGLGSAAETQTTDRTGVGCCTAAAERRYLASIADTVLPPGE